MPDLIRNAVFLFALIALSVGCAMERQSLALIVPASILLGVLAYPYLVQPKGGK